MGGWADMPERMPHAEGPVPCRRSGSGESGPTDPGVARVAVLLDVAAELGTGVRVEELAGLLPKDASDLSPHFREWLTARPDLAEVVDEWAFLPGRELRPDPGAAARAADYEAAARSGCDERLGGSSPWLRCVAITGSTAYGAPRAGDDLDLFLITRPGLLWLVMARIYAGQWIARSAGKLRPGPRWCVNFVRDECSATEEFGRPGDLLFAREALTARVLWGEEYYRRLLDRAGWMRAEVPGLYARRRDGARETAAEPAAPPRLLRLLNLLAFVAVAPYLQAVGLRRNDRLRRAGRGEALFRTETTRRRLSISSVRFEAIRRRYSGGGLAPPVTAAIGRGPGGAAADPTPRERARGSPARRAPEANPDGDPPGSPSPGSSGPGAARGSGG